MPGISNILRLLLVIYWLGLEVASAQVDGTLMTGQSGINVVIAVIEKLNASQVFNVSQSLWYDIDGQRALVKQFLRYKAFIETEYGERPNGPGGIWRVTEEQFDETVDYVNDNDYLRSRINNSLLLHTDWLSVAYENMSIPMYSGLATMLRLDQLLQYETIGLLTEGRLAHLWKEHFGGNDIHRWHNGTKYLIDHLRQSKY